MDARVERLIGVLKLAQERSQQSAELTTTFFSNLTAATNVETAKKLAKALQDRSTPLLEEERKALAEAADLAQQLGDLAAPAPATPGVAVRAEDIARHFRTLVDTVQLDARAPKAGELATTLKSFDVEIKGLIVVDDKEARVVTPTPERVIDPAQLSTIRMSFASIPVLPVRDVVTPDKPR
jgi:hypothetical protein